jgi:hypothetical protein
MLEARFKIEPVRTAADLEVTVRLFNEYASSVGVDLSYQDFATELTSLSGKYALPMGLVQEHYGLADYRSFLRSNARHVGYATE